MKHLLILFLLFSSCKTTHYHLEECTVNVCYEHKIDKDTIHEHETMKVERVKLIKK